MDPSDSWTSSAPVTARVSAAEAVLADLRRAITSGALPVGGRLPAESALAARYGVSRSVVREALRSCEALGLTRTRTGCGTWVVSATVASTLTVGDWTSADIVEARPHIEVPAAGLAARRRSADDCATLGRLVEGMDETTDPARWVGLDADFHAAIARATGNPLLVALQTTMRAALSRQSETLNLVGHRRKAANQEHAAIAAAIVDGVPERAEAAMTDHLDRVAAALTAVLTGGGDGDGTEPGA